MVDGLHDWISKMEDLKNQAIAERGALMAQVEAKEDHIEMIDARLKELIWVEKQIEKLAEPELMEENASDKNGEVRIIRPARGERE